MVSHEQCYPVPRAVIGAFVTLAILTASAVGQASGNRFYPDDPLLKEPPPRPVKELAKRDVDDMYDFLDNSLVTQGGQNCPARTPRGAGRKHAG